MYAAFTDHFWKIVKFVTLIISFFCQFDSFLDPCLNAFTFLQSLRSIIAIDHGWSWSYCHDLHCRHSRSSIVTWQFISSCCESGASIIYSKSLVDRGFSSFLHRMDACKHETVLSFLQNLKCLFATVSDIFLQFIHAGLQTVDFGSM